MLPAKSAAEGGENMDLTAIREDVEGRFRAVARALLSGVDETQAELHSQVGQTIEGAALTVLGLIPEGREASLVLTKLEEAMLWAHEALAKGAGGAQPAQPAPVAPAGPPAATTPAAPTVPLATAPAEPVGASAGS